MQSLLGIVWSAVTCVVMLALAAGKARTGRALDNPVPQTEACAKPDLIRACRSLVAVRRRTLEAWSRFIRGA
jgi:hypothetical protein